MIPPGKRPSYWNDPPVATARPIALDSYSKNSGSDSSDRARLTQSTADFTRYQRSPALAGARFRPLFGAENPGFESRESN